MRLNQKIMLWTLAAVGVAYLLLHGVFHGLVLDGFKRLELAEAGKDMDRCVRVLEQEVEAVATTSTDYGDWDAFHAVMASFDPSFVTENMSLNVLQNSEIHLLIISDVKGRILWQEVHEPAQWRDLRLEGLGGILVENGHGLLGPAQVEKQITGIIATERGFMAIASAPIRDGLGKAPARGKVTMGRFLHPAKIEELNRKIGVSFVIGQAPMERYGNGKSRFDTAMPERLTGMVLLNGVDGMPVLEITMTKPRDILRQGQGIIRLAILAMVGAMGGLTLLYVALLLRNVTRPLAKMCRQAVEIGESQDFRRNLVEAGCNETATLAREVNLLLFRLRETNDHLEELVEARTGELVQANARLTEEIGERERAEAILREANQQLLLAGHVFENSLEYIVITDRDGNIQSVNPAFESITGYGRAEAIGQNPRLLKSGRHDAEFYQRMWDCLLHEGRWQGEVWNRRKNGEIFPSFSSIVAVRDDSGGIRNFFSVAYDISNIKKSEERIRFLAYHDALTGLPNRMLFLDRLGLAMAHCRRHAEQLAVLFLDLDNFKQVNDFYGHSTGDQLLCAVTQRIQQVLRRDDTFCRLGGDEFLLLLPGLKGLNCACALGEKILSVLSAPFHIMGVEIVISVSIGISIFPDDVAAENGNEAEALIKSADIAMYRAKDAGKCGFQVFKAEMNERIGRRMLLEKRMRADLEGGGFRVFFQPRVELATGRVVGLEALARWHDEKGELLLPDHFIPLAEETGLIVPLGEWVLGEACRQAVEWGRQLGRELEVSVNISPRQFMHGDIVTMVKKALAETGLPPALLELEITENILLDNFEECLRTMNQLRELGVRFALDDFGTGYSSLYYLKRLPIGVLKVDRSFIKDVPQDEDDKAITETIISMARIFNLIVVAEGVETEAQRDFLSSLGCSLQIQGFLYAPPLPTDEVLAFIQQGEREAVWAQRG
ncbi:MAG: bifunctional diguanylate cyclase/phosphodiesterase [Thermodesulfobacteriota bacterium]